MTNRIESRGEPDLFSVLFSFSSSSSSSFPRNTLNICNDVSAYKPPWLYQCYRLCASKTVEQCPKKRTMVGVSYCLVNSCSKKDGWFLGCTSEWIEYARYTTDVVALRRHRRRGKALKSKNWKDWLSCDCLLKIDCEGHRVCRSVFDRQAFSNDRVRICVFVYNRCV